MTRFQRCRKCDSVVLERESVRFSLRPVRVEPMSEVSMDCYVCSKCAKSILAATLVPRLVRAAI